MILIRTRIDVLLKSVPRGGSGVITTDAFLLTGGAMEVSTVALVKTSPIVIAVSHSQITTTIVHHRWLRSRFRCPTELR